MFGKPCSSAPGGLRAEWGPVLPEDALKLKFEEELNGEPELGAVAEAVLVGDAIVSDSSSSLTFCILPARAAVGLKEPPPPNGLVPGKVDSAMLSERLGW